MSKDDMITWKFDDGEVFSMPLREYEQLMKRSDAAATILGDPEARKQMLMALLLDPAAIKLAEKYIHSSTMRLRNKARVERYNDVRRLVTTDWIIRGKPRSGRQKFADEMVEKYKAYESSTFKISADTIRKTWISDKGVREFLDSIVLEDDL